MIQKNKIVSNFIYQFLYQLLTILLPIITSPYLSRILGSEATGIYTYTYVIASYFVIFAMLGIESYGNRTIAKIKNQGKDSINRTFSSIFYMHLIVSIIVLLGYIIYIFFIVAEYKEIAIIQVFFVISSVLDINWFFFGIEKFKITVTRNFIIKILTMCLIFLFVKSKSDLWIYSLIMSLGTLISQSFVWFTLPRYAKFVKVSFKDIFKHFKPLLVLFIAVIAVNLYRMIDKLMLGNTGDMKILGEYEYSDKIIKVAVTAITALGVVMLPRMTTLKSEKSDKINAILRISSQFMFILAFAIFFGIASIAKEFIPIFLGEGYEEAVLLVIILSFSIPIMGWNNFIRTQVLIPNEKDLVYTIAVSIGAIVDIILNIILINYYGAYGAAISTVIAYFIVGLFQTIPIYKLISCNELFKNAIIPIFCGIVMCTFVRFVASLNFSGILSIVLEILVGAISYLSTLFVMMKLTNNELYEIFILKFKKRG